MPDFNPDKERHVDHKFVVQKAMPGDDLSEPVLTSKGPLKPDGQGRMMVKDESLAREIQQQHPRELTVTRMRTPGAADRGHRYFFGALPGLPWHKHDEYGRRIRDTEPLEEAVSLPDEPPAEVQDKEMDNGESE